MKTWKSGRSFVLGFLAAALVLSLTVPTLAALSGKTIQVYTGVDVYVNDQLIEPKDVNGNPVDVFVYNGTTYLPIRAIGNALGMPVDWDGQTTSAYVGKHRSDRPAVWLKDLDYFVSNGRDFTVQTVKDNLGNTHPNAMTRRSNLYDSSATYIINGQYSAISGTFFQEYEHRSDTRVTSLEICGDGKVLYTATMTAGVKPADFKVDLTGVLELQVSITGQGTNYQYGYIGDFALWT